MITTFVEITGKKLVGDLFAPPSPTILNRIESYCIKMECTWNSKMATQKVDRFCHSCGELYDENNSFCVKCSNNRRSTLDSKGDTGLQRRIQRFWKGGHSMLATEWPRKKILGFRWSKKTKITLETKSVWQNISTSIFKFSPFLYTPLVDGIWSIFQNLKMLW